MCQTRKNKIKKKIEKKIIWLFLYLLITSIYLVWRSSSTIPFDYGITSIIFGVCLLIAEFVGFFESILFYFTLYRIDTPLTPRIDNDEEFPEVDIFVATYNEPISLLYKTLVGCKNMQYPDKSKIHIYLCDDGDREEARKLCKKLNISYITRINKEHAKAGNINNALSKTTSPYFVTFDADMIPMSDFLLSTVPFVINNENIGFVQVPQNFYNVDPFQYNLFMENKIPNEQDLFARLIQAGKSHYNAVIYAGSNTLLSRKAVEEIGGFVVGTITEDFATGMLIQSKGYECIYLNEVHASGLSPDSIEDLYNQRIRWGRGVIQTFKKNNPFKMKGLSIAQKVMYFSALLYWYFGIWRFIYFLAPILFSVFGVVVMKAPLMQVLIFWIPMFIITKFVFRSFTGGMRTSLWSHVYDTILFPQITMGVVKETIGFKMGTFKVTPKDKHTQNKYINKYYLVYTQIILFGLTLVGVIRDLYFMIVLNNIFSSYMINLFWSLYNLYLLLLAIFFASERPKFRTSERLAIKTTANIDVLGKKISGITQDISETGFSILLQDIVYIDSDKSYLIEIKTENYSSVFYAKLVFSKNHKKGYIYSFMITEINEENFKQLLHILYDRQPTTIRKIKETNPFIDIRNYIFHRKRKLNKMNRKLPRIKINKTLLAYCDQEVNEIYVYDFNLMYCSIKKIPKMCSDLKIILDEQKGIFIKCKLDKNLSSKKKDRLVYLIENGDELVDINLNLYF